MSKDSRSSINPFTGKEHYDTVDDDAFLKQCYEKYYQDINQSRLLDETPQGQLVIKVASKLVNTVEEFLIKIGRYDYMEDYYDWEFHLSANNETNAYCMPGGKILVYSGILPVANNEEKLAFILGHEMAHALLDHGRTKISAYNTKNAITTVSWLGSFALDIMGFGSVGNIARTATSIVDIGSDFFLINPWGRDQELEADKLGMIIIHLAGYDIKPIPDFWHEFTGEKAGTFDFFSTHPADDKRIAVMIESLENILNETDFYSKPILPETPVPKEEYKLLNRNKQDYIAPSIHQTPSDVTLVDNDFKQQNTNTERKCSNCGNVILSDSKFCIHCGNKLDTELKCEKCGGKVKPGDSFCIHCGNKLDTELKCEKCGGKVKQKDIICNICGNKL